jgi:hypothetical protein
MAITCHAWYDRNAQRPYPLDDQATTLDDEGRPLPPDILVDASLWYPAGLGSGRVPVLAAVTLTEKLVSVLFTLRDTSGTSDRLLGAVALSRPVDEGRLHAITPLPDPYDPDSEAAGWLVFGPGANQRLLQARFSGSDAAQSRLARIACRPFGADIVPGVGQTLGGLLRGAVTLQGNDELLVTTRPIEWDGLQYPAVVLGLSQALEAGALARYVGPCGGRPESQSCNRPSVETIGEAAPDCAGQFVLAFPEAEVVPYPGNQGGALLIYDVALDDVCPGLRPTHLPEDLCGSSSSSSSSISSSSSSLAEPEPPPEDSSSSSSEGPPPDPWGAPYWLDFRTTGVPASHTGSGLGSRTEQIPPGWTAYEGGFWWENTSPRDDLDLSEEPSSSTNDLTYAAVNTASRNLLVWSDCNHFLGLQNALGFVAGAIFKLRRSVERNAGVLLNYRHHGSPTGRPTYVAALLDAQSGTLAIKSYDGRQYTVLGAASLAGGVLPTPGHFYWIYLGAWVDPRDSAKVILRAQLNRTNRLQRLDLSSLTVSVPASRFGPPVGAPGVLTQNAFVNFAYFDYAAVT